MKFKVGYFLTALALTAASFSGLAENKLRFNSSAAKDLPESMRTGPEAPVIVTVSAANLVGQSIVSLSYDGEVLSSEAVSRLQALLENGSDALINTTIAPSGDFGLYLDGTPGPWITKNQYYDIPATIPFDIPVHIQVHMSTWSGDSDASRFMLGAQKLDETWTTMLNTEFSDWPYSGTWRETDVTFTPEYDRILFNGTCQRYSGTNCDGWIRGPAVTFNPDLPPVGAQVEVVFQ